MLLIVIPPKFEPLELKYPQCDNKASVMAQSLSTALEPVTNSSL